MTLKGVYSLVPWNLWIIRLDVAQKGFADLTKDKDFEMGRLSWII